MFRVTRNMFFPHCRCGEPLDALYGILTFPFTMPQRRKCLPTTAGIPLSESTLLRHQGSVSRRFCAACNFCPLAVLFPTLSRAF